MKKLSFVCIILAAVSLFALYGCFIRKQPVTVVSTTDTAPQVSLSVEHLYEIVEPCEKLVTVSDQYSNKGTITKDTKLWGHKVPFTTDQISFSYTGTILVGVDLSGIDFDINEASRTIYITLPTPTIISHSIDTSSFSFTTEHDGFITDILPEEFASKANMLKSEQEDKLVRDGKAFDEAKANSEAALTKLIKAAPEANSYKLRFYYN